MVKHEEVGWGNDANVTEELAKDMDLDEAKGALVQQVVKDGPMIKLE